MLAPAIPQAAPAREPLSFLLESQAPGCGIDHDLSIGPASYGQLKKSKTQAKHDSHPGFLLSGDYTYWPLQKFEMTKLSHGGKAPVRP